jgi:hypothetical protein
MISPATGRAEVEKVKQNFTDINNGISGTSEYASQN